MKRVFEFVILVRRQSNVIIIGKFCMEEVVPFSTLKLFYYHKLHDIWIAVQKTIFIMAFQLTVSLLVKITRHLHVKPRIFDFQ